MSMPSRPGWSGVPDDQDAGIGLKLLLLLGALSAFAPLSFDMYLPALPQVSRNLHIDGSAVQLTLSACLIGLALGQLFGGPLSDATGRRRPLLAGVGAYTVFSLCCAVSPNVATLVAARFLQGFAGGIAIVIANAIVRDRTSGQAAARVFSLLILITGVAPSIAPVIGGQLIRVVSWRGIFVVLAAIGALIWAAATAAAETLPPDRRRSGGWRDIRSTARQLAADRDFAGRAAALGLAFGAMFAYISGSSFVLQDDYGLSPQTYSAVFAGIALGLVAVGRVNASLVRRAGAHRLLIAGLVQLTLGGALLFAVVQARLSAPFVVAALLLAVTSVSLVGPNATALALTPYGHQAGSVAAILGLVQFGVGAIVSPLASVSGRTTQFSLAYLMLIMSVLALVAYLAVPRVRHRPRTPTRALQEQPAGEAPLSMHQEREIATTYLGGRYQHAGKFVRLACVAGVERNDSVSSQRAQVAAGGRRAWARSSGSEVRNGISAAERPGSHVPSRHVGAQ
jgi:MFS transporter, DHA1 family, multidrug resistance protein